VSLLKRILRKMTALLRSSQSPTLLRLAVLLNTLVKEKINKVNLRSSDASTSSLLFTLPLLRDGPDATSLAFPRRKPSTWTHLPPTRLTGPSVPLKMVPSLK
jgi:hypothetical protein